MIWVNDAMCALLEKNGTKESYLGQRSGLFFRNDATARTLSDKAMEERKTLSGEFDYTTPSGRQLRVSVHTTPFYDLDGVMLGAIAFWNDLTEIHSQKSRIEAQNAAIARAAVEAGQVVERMAQASQQLSAQIGKSSSGAREQSHRVQDTAAAVEEMNATILEVARNAGATSESADAVKQKAPGRRGAGFLCGRSRVGHPGRVRPTDGDYAASGRTGPGYRDHHGRDFGYCRPDQPAGA